MSKNYLTKGLLLFAFGLASQLADAQTLIHYWNFNDNSTVAAITAPTQSAVTGSSITHIAGGISAIDLGGTGQNFNVLNLNAQNGDAFGTHLRFNDPIGGALVFAIPSTGFENIVVNLQHAVQGQVRVRRYGHTL